MKSLSFKERAIIRSWRSLIISGRVASLLDRTRFPNKVSSFTYGDHPRETGDHILPHSLAPKKKPVVYIHGGGWVCGDRRLYNKQMATFAQAGHPVFNLSYPLAPESPFPAALLSIFKALNWIHNNLPQHKEIHLVGDSAGGNLVAMTTIISENPDLENALNANLPSIPKVASMASLYGVMDKNSWLEDGFPSASSFMNAYMKNSNSEKDTNKITPMDLAFSNLPPTFIAAGSKDRLARSSDIFAQHLKEQNIVHEYRIYEGAIHGFFSFGKGRLELMKDLLAFLD